MDPDSKNFNPDLSNTLFRSLKLQIATENELKEVMDKITVFCLAEFCQISEIGESNLLWVVKGY